MGEKAPPADKASEKDDVGRWPLSYRIQAPQQAKHQVTLDQHAEGHTASSRKPLASAAVPKKWWSHNLYRGPDNKAVKVLYSKDKARSEELAQLFLKEPLIGFDMEWPSDSDKRHRLQEKIGLIQVACEDKIALFHIGLHSGKTPGDIIAPSLKKLIESATIAKTGVGIFWADFSRLKKWFGLKPQGALELSHLHRLVKFSKKPELLTTKLTKLAYQVEEHLGFPLSKGSVRTSNWSKPLNQQQINYAADDAYAGFMLFHCMNAKRATMDPVPPLPIFAEQYPPTTTSMASPRTLRLYPLKEGLGTTMADEFFRAAKEIITAKTDDVEEPSKSKVESPSKRNSKQPSTKSDSSREPLTVTEKALFDELALRRAALAQDQGLVAYRVATNAVLEGIARQRPRTEEELLNIKGVGKKQGEKFGVEWLEVIAQTAVLLEVEAITDARPLDRPVTPTHPPRRSQLGRVVSPDSSPGFGSPLQRTPVLHTGLSFTMAETNLDSEDEMTDEAHSPTWRRSTFSHVDGCDTGISGPIDSDQPVSEDPRRIAAKSLRQDMESGSPSPGSSQLKRKRPGTPPRNQRSTSSQEQPPLLFTPQSKIFRNKLLAFSKLVSRKLPPQLARASPIVSDSTLDRIVVVAPRTAEDLDHIPGIQTFVQACRDADMDLLKNIIKFSPSRC